MYVHQWGRGGSTKHAYRLGASLLVSGKNQFIPQALPFFA